MDVQINDLDNPQKLNPKLTMAKAEASKVTEIGSTATGVKKRGLGGSV